jgi:hypothetical protein
MHANIKFPLNNDGILFKNCVQAPFHTSKTQSFLPYITNTILMHGIIEPIAKSSHKRRLSDFEKATEIISSFFKIPSEEVCRCHRVGTWSKLLRLFWGTSTHQQ